MLKAIKPTVPNSDKIILDMMQTAVEQELVWSNHILQNILGVSEQSTEQYTKHLANRRLKNIGLEPIYTGTSNPYKHLEKIADVQADATVKGNFFETSVTTYNMSSAISGWEDI
jgi:ribonucleoside-diphosphate reductase beta chain